MKQPSKIFLVGPMGAGKSAVGKQLARSLHLDFVDSDDEIEARTGVDIPFIFEKEGEDGFRQREAAVIADLTKKDNIVLATGFDLFDCSKVTQYGYGRLANVFTSLEFERMCNASGPTDGHIVLRDGKTEPKTAAELVTSTRPGLGDVVVMTRSAANSPGWRS